MSNETQREFPKTIAENVNGTYRTEDIGRSGSEVLIFSDRVLKIEKTSAFSDREHVILFWLDGKLPAPRVIAFEQENECNYLLMTRQNGKMACDCGLPEETVSRLLAEGLQMLWKTDISDCPVRFDMKILLMEAKKQIENGSLEGLTPQNGEFPDFEILYRYLSENIPEEEFVFSHGDYCLPNVFVSEKEVCGFLDLGSAGISDRYRDIHMCLWSMRYNFVTLGGMKEERFARCREIFFETLGIKENEEKLRYFSLLDEFFV
ncbi:MAG: aminoglycoside 3'-phosphotransferase [Clostridia bacterium]|nr:aminoglycoside 3'-phosphotransferase [Clostridia bacterium]